MRRERAEEAAEGAGEQQGAGGRVHALAGDVGEDDLQGASAVGAGGDDEVPGEGLAAGRAQRHLSVPALREAGQGALDPDAFAQVEEHGAAAPPGHADAGPELGDEEPEEAAGGDDEDGAGGDPGGALGVRAEDHGLDDEGARGGRVQAEQAGGAQQQAAGHDRQGERGGRAPDRVDQGAGGDGRDREEEPGEGEPVGAVPAEVVHGGLAQRNAGPAHAPACPGRVRAHSVAVSHGPGPYPSRPASCRGTPVTMCAKSGRPGRGPLISMAYDWGHDY